MYNKELELKRVFKAFVADPEEFYTLFNAHMYESHFWQKEDQVECATLLKTLEKHAGKRPEQIAPHFELGINSLDVISRVNLRNNKVKWLELFASISPSDYTPKTSTWVKSILDETVELDEDLGID